MKQGKLFILSGQSGVGKNTILKDLLSRHPKFHRVVTFTTREIRPEEIPGEDHFFIYPEKFQEMVKNNEFLEYAQVHNDYYGTPKKQINDVLSSGQNALMEIDVQGVEQIKKSIPDCISIFIKYDTNDLANIIRQRIKNDPKRGETDKEEISRRIKSAYEEAKYEKNYDYAVINPEGHPEKAVGEIEEIIKKENKPTKTLQYSAECWSIH